MADWIVRAYNKNNRVIKKWIIKDRTEHEAENEAMAELSYLSNVWDWTMMIVTK